MQDYGQVQNLAEGVDSLLQQVTDGLYAHQNDKTYHSLPNVYSTQTGIRIRRADYSTGNSSYSQGDHFHSGSEGITL